MPRQDIQLQEEEVSALGLWSLRLFLISFALSPIAAFVRLPWLRQCRRLFGLWGFAFAAAHAVTYILTMQVWPRSMQLLVKQPYLLCGTASFLMMMALAATSPGWIVQRIGPMRRKRIHRMIYAAMILAVLHEYLYEHDGYAEIGAHAVLVAGLILARLLATRFPLMRSRILPSRSRPHPR